jgi:hypothetical protein
MPLSDRVDDAAQTRRARKLVDTAIAEEETVLDLAAA